MSEFDFELENIAASDLVTFLPVRDCFSNETRMRVLWDIGDDFVPDVWDYIGLYNTEWETVSDHLAYKWAPHLPRNAYSVRRRCVHFTDVDFDHVRMPGVDFQFLYVANGNHVVGVSNSFRFPRTPGYDDDVYFNNLERQSRPKPSYLVPIPLGAICDDDQNICNLEKLSRPKSALPVSLGFDGNLCLDTLERLANPKQKPSTSDILDDELCFETIERLARSKSKKRKQSRQKSYCKHLSEAKKRQPNENVVHIVRDFQLCSPSKRRTFKEKVLKIFKDHESLKSNFNNTRDWRTALDIVHPVVKEYDENEALSVVPYIPIETRECKQELSDLCMAQVAVMKKEKCRKKKLIFDIKQQARQLLEKHIGSLEFPVRLPLTPGPQGILEVMSTGAGPCAFCRCSRVVISELVRQQEAKESTIRNLKTELKTAETTKVKDVPVQKRQKKRHQPRKFAGSKEELLCKKKIGDLLRKNNGLLKQARYWKKECLATRSELKRLKIPEKKDVQQDQAIPNEKEQETQTVGHVIPEAVRALETHVTDSGCNTCSTMSEPSPFDEEADGWHLQKPKRIARLQKVVSKQSQTIQSVSKTVSNQREAINRQAMEIAKLKKTLCEHQREKTAAEGKLTEMTERIKSILRQRYKEKSTEWRQFARKLSNENIHDVRPSGAAVPASRGLELSSKNKRPFFGGVSNSLYGGLQYVPGKSERVCPTCKVTFGPQVDPHVIEEHIVFHQVYNKNKKSHAD